MKKKKKWIAVFKVKSTAKVQNVNECLSGWYLLNRGIFCYQTCSGVWASWKSCVLSSSQGHSKGHIWSQYDSFFYISWTAKSLTNKSWSGGTSAKARVSRKKKQNLIEFLCILYLLCHWPLGNQIGCADILLLKNKPSTTEWACTDSNTGLSVTSHAPGGGV